jgi:hypothetical protein
MNKWAVDAVYLSCANIPVILTILFLTLYQISPKLWLQLWQHQMQAFWMIWDLGQSQDPLNITSWLNFETVCGGLDEQIPDLSWGG